MSAGNVSASKKRRRSVDTGHDSSLSRLPSTHEAIPESESAEQNPQTSGGSGDADMLDRATASLVSFHLSSLSLHRASSLLLHWQAIYIRPHTSLQPLSIRNCLHSSIKHTAIEEQSACRFSRQAVLSRSLGRLTAPG